VFYEQQEKGITRGFRRWLQELAGCETDKSFAHCEETFEGAEGEEGVDGGGGKENMMKKHFTFLLTVGVMIALSVFSIGVLNSCASNGTVQSENTNFSENVSSISIGYYHENERNLLTVGFIYAVNRWLRRYSPQMLTQNNDYVKMRVKYDYFYNVELFIKDDTFEILVTFADDRRQPSDAQKDAIHLSTGIYKVMDDYIVNRSSARR